jgi:hypothetical protein
MAFIFAVNLAEPIPAQIFRRSGDRAIVAHVGMDSECPLSYQIIVGISVGAGCDEYYFKLVEIDAESGEEREYWDGREVGAFINENDRSKILEVIKRVTKLLLIRELTDSFYCCTHGDNLPPHALEKHEAINQIFVECGYQVTLTGCDRGRYSWWVERHGENGCCVA